MMIVASVRSTPITPKTTGMAIVSALLDGWGLSPCGSMSCPRPVQDADVDDEFKDIPSSGVLWQKKSIFQATEFFPSNFGRAE